MTPEEYEELKALRAAKQDAELRDKAAKAVEDVIEKQKEAIAGVQASLEKPANPYRKTGWGEQNRQEFDIECPSGQLCRARTLTVEDAMGLGLLDSLDLFTSTLMAPIMATEEDQAVAEEERNAGILNGLKDPEKRMNFFGTINRVVVHCVTIPSIVLEDDGNLADDEVFANDIPFADKMHIFRRVFGGAGNATMNTFREGQDPGVEPVSDGSDVPGASE
jgi:hypothetical protein